VLGFDTCARTGARARTRSSIGVHGPRLREARQRGANIARLAATSPGGSRSALGNLKRGPTLTTARALLGLPDRDGREICMMVRPAFRRAGSRRRRACLGRTQTAVFKAQHVFGYWVDTTAKSGLPALREMTNT